MLCICYVMGRVVCSLVSNQVGIELCIPFITYFLKILSLPYPRGKRPNWL